MTLTEEKKGTLTTLVTIHLKKEDFEPKVNASLKKAVKNVAMKGFRPGQAPMSLVKKMYGNSILWEDINELLQNEIYNYVTSNKLDTLGQPIPANDNKLDLDINNLSDIDFTFEIGIAPQIDLAVLSDAPAFTKYIVKTDDAMMEDEIKRIRKRYADYEYPEDVVDNDILSITVEELDADGNVKEGGVSEVTSIMPDMLKADERASFLAMKKQESITKNIWNVFERSKEEVAKHVLNITHTEKLENIGDNFKITLNNITRAIPAEMNEDFFAKAYGENGPKNETEMRELIQRDFDAYLEGQSDNYLMNEIYLYLMDKVNIELPEAFLKRWIKLTNEKPISDEEIDKDYPSFAKQIKWELIVKKLMTENDITVSIDEIKERARVQTIQQFMQYGLSNFDESWLGPIIAKQMSDKKYVDRTREQLLEDKALFAAKQKVATVDKDISFDDFKLMLETPKA